MRMIEARSGYGFAPKTFNQIGIAEILRVEHFERNVPLQSWIEGTINSGHTALADHGLDLVAAQRCVDEIV